MAAAICADRSASALGKNTTGAPPECANVCALGPICAPGNPGCKPAICAPGNPGSKPTICGCTIGVVPIGAAGDPTGAWPIGALPGRIPDGRSPALSCPELPHCASGNPGGKLTICGCTISVVPIGAAVDPTGAWPIGALLGPIKDGRSPALSCLELHFESSA